MQNVNINLVPANTNHSPNVGSMWGKRRKLWANIGPTLGRCVVFSRVRQ